MESSVSTQNMPARTYLDEIRGQAPRVLSRLDRDPFSPTYGCLDRTYWAWKFTDFPGARFQEGLCFLAFLWATPFEESPYHENDNLRRWIEGGIDFWAGIQRKTGDFDEAYPLERSLAATAFTAFYLSEARGFLGPALSPEVGRRLRTALTRAGDWLIRNDEHHGFLSNHLAAAAAALLHIHLVTGDARYEKRSRHFLDKILAHQSSEGWYEEYGGADPGYQTHGSFYLARYQELSGDQNLAASLDRSFEFLAHFVHPDGSIGGEYASRNTQTYYPAAFEMTASRSASASWIAEELRPSVSSLAAAGMRTVDAYNLFPLLNNYVFACRAARERESTVPPREPATSGALHFPAAGLLKIRRERYDLFLGLHKGGVVKLFDREGKRLVFSNCGYIGRLKNGGIFSNQWIDRERRIDLEDDEIVIEGGFYQISRVVMKPVRFLAFRVFSLTMGRIPRFAYWLKSVLVKVLIHRKKDLDLSFERRILLHDDGVEIRDKIRGGMGSRIETLVSGAAFSTIHMGSARYFVPHELLTAPEGDFSEAVDPRSLAPGAERGVRVRVP